MFDEEKFKRQLLKLAHVEMPFGRYQGKKIIEIPEEYLLWFQNKGFPKGELGELLAFALEVRIAGAEQLVYPLMKDS